MVHPVVRALAPDGVPLCVTEGFTAPTTALRTHVGPWGQPPRQPAPGPVPKPRWLPLPQLCSAQVVQSARRRRGVCVRHRLVVGTLERVTKRVASHGWQINPACLARAPRTLRQPVAAVGRRVLTGCQGEAGGRQPRAVDHTDDNFGVPHAR
jgi:hypothetical protein